MASAYTQRVDQLIAGACTRYVFPTPASEVAQGAPLVLHQHFSVCGEARTLQARAWSDYVGRILEAPVSREQVEAGFQGKIDSYVLQDMVYLDSRTDPLFQARSIAKISRDDVRNFVFHVAVEGIMETVTDPSRQRRSEQFVPGVLALDMGQPMRMRRPTRARVLAFFLPRERVANVIADPESIHGRVLSYTSPLGRLLPGELLHLCRRLPMMGQADAQRAIHLCADLILAAFAKQERLGGGSRAMLRRAQMERVKRYIAANLHNKELGADEIINSFPLSRPTLYRMFEAEGGLAAYVRNCRLWAAAGELVELPQASVAEIAYGLGFGSASDFSRAFKRAYGAAPLDFRAAGAHWLL